MNSVELIYLACPFRHADPSVQKKRCAAAHYTAAQLFLKGKHVFSPLTHNETLIDLLNDAIPGERWMQFDLAILAHCQSLYILKMEGWQLSKGVERERLFALEKGIPIYELEPPEEDLYRQYFKNRVWNGTESCQELILGKGG